MAQQLTELVEQFCNFRLKQRGKTEGGVQTYRWILEQFLIFIRNRHGRLARVTDLTPAVIQAWMDDMAARDLALTTMRVRQSRIRSTSAIARRGSLSSSTTYAWSEKKPRGEGVCGTITISRRRV